MNIKDLAAEFPRDQIHWRAQTLTKSQKKALALAYLDARDVMDRLDEVCGPENWQDEYVETPKGRIICRIGIRTSDGWVWKSDGAGETAVEGDKGGISDAFKRAAVHWGIGRYLYRMGAVWAPCETYNGKWSSWKGSPWDSVRQNNKKPAAPVPFNADESYKRISTAIKAQTEIAKLEAFWKQRNVTELFAQFNDDDKAALLQEYTSRCGELVEDGRDAA